MGEDECRNTALIEPLGDVSAFLIHGKGGIRQPGKR